MALVRTVRVERLGVGRVADRALVLRQRWTWRETSQAASLVAAVRKGSLVSLLHSLHDERRSAWSGPLTSSSPEIAKYFTDPPAKSGVVVNGETALTYPPFWAAVQLISSDIASTPLIFYKREPNGGKSRFASHQLYRILHDEPNPEMTAFVFRETLQAHVLTWGNAYAEIERDRLGRVSALWPLTPNRVQPFRERRGGTLQYAVANDDGAGGVVLDARDVLHVPGLGYDGYCGYSVVAKARESLGLGLAMQQMGATFFGNGSTFGGVFTTQRPMGPKEKTDWIAETKKFHQGIDRAHRFILLEGGMDYKRLGIPPDDAQWIESRQFHISDVARWFNLSPHKLADLSRATFSNIEHLSIDHIATCLRRWMVRWEQEINRKLIAPAERNIQFCEHLIDGLLRGDQASRYAAYAVGRQWGWLSADDVREKENMNPLPNGSGTIYLVPQNMWPADKVDQMISAQASKGQPAPTKPTDDESKDDETIKSLTRQLESLTERTRLAEECVAEYRAKVEAKDATISEMTERLGSQHADVIDARAERDKLAEQTGHLVLLTAELSATRDRMASELAEARGLADGRAVELDAARAAIEAADAASAEARDKAERLRVAAEAAQEAARTAREQASAAAEEARLAEMREAEARTREAAERTAREAADAERLATASVRDAALADLETAHGQERAAREQADAAAETARVATEREADARASQDTERLAREAAEAQLRAVEHERDEARFAVAQTKAEVETAIAQVDEAQRRADAAEAARANAATLASTTAEERAQFEADATILRARAATSLAEWEAREADLSAAVERERAAREAVEAAHATDRDRIVTLDAQIAERSAALAAMTETRTAESVQMLALIEAKQVAEQERDAALGEMGVVSERSAADQARIAEYEAQIAEKAAALDLLTQERASDQAVIDEARAAFAEVEQRWTLVQDQVAVNEALRASEQAQAAAHEATIRDLQTQLTTLAETKAATETAVDGLRTAIAALERERDEARATAAAEASRVAGEIEARQRIELNLRDFEASERDRVASVLSAHRALIVDVMRRMVERETDRARRAQTTPEKLRHWIDTFYPGHEELCVTALLPAIRVHTSWMGRHEDAEVLTRQLVRQHIEESKRQISAVADGDSDELAGSLYQLFERWDRDRVAAIADTLLTKEIDRATDAR